MAYEETAKFTLFIYTDDERYNTRKNYIGDAGVDLYTLEDYYVQPFEKIKIDLGIKCKMINNTTNTLVSYFLEMRSSICKTEFSMCNAHGIIDAGYRGNLIAYVRNMSNTPQILKKGSYFQIVEPGLNKINVIILPESKVEIEDENNRNNNGFGSTKK